MALKVFNTETRSLGAFVPLESGKVRVYACGPTIYDHAHIGNFRTFLFFDVVHRHLEWSGYDVRFVMNLTDVDDKTIKGAVAVGKSVADFTGPFGDAFLADCQRLGMLPADSYPRATAYISQMVDFALWKRAVPADEQAHAAWDSPWGRGRPGWHLECSVMSLTELGDTLDLHLGGEDLVFPHHENEIAQSEASTGKPFVRNWLHVKHLQVEGRKMSKSLGNFVTVRQLLDEGFDPASIRHQLLSAHYRSDLNFTREGLNASRSAVQRLVDFDDRLAAAPTGGSTPTELPRIAAETVEAVRAAMDNDFNTADALGALFGMVSRVNTLLDARAPVPAADVKAVRDALASMDRVLGLLQVARASRSVDDGVAAWVEERIQARADARKRKDFAAADAIRAEIAARGIAIEDGPGGTRWKVTDAAAARAG